MTREEAIKIGLKMGTSDLGIDLSGVIPSLINKIYDDVESLQTPKTCDGCLWEFKYKFLDDGTDLCTLCSRNEHLNDYYEPKDK